MDNKISDIIKQEPHPGFIRKNLKWALALGVLAAALWAMGIFSTNGKETVTYKSQPITRGDLTITVTATGTLEPLNKVDVGTEVSGTIRSVLADFNDHVEAGQPLVRLDTDKLDAQVMSARASLESAEARVLEAQATELQAADALARALKLHNQSEGRLPAQKDIDDARASAKRAEASVAMARAQVSEARASLKVNETTLTKATIRAPISGVVLTRNIEPGQTVAASLQSPVLFTLAQDLARMELQVDVDEADVGKLKPGQEATFTVDAYPEQKFKATVKEVRLSPQRVEGVVTYRTLLSVDNSSMLLRPGMTATATVTIETLKGILLAPSAALRYSPTLINAEAKDDGGLMAKLMPWGQRRARPNNQNGKKEKVLWVLKDNAPVAIKITTGASSGALVEVRGDGLNEGLAVIVDEQRAAK